MAAGAARRPLLLAGVSSISSQASLIVAAADLNLVRLVVGAIRTADLSSAAHNGPAAEPAAVLPRQHIQPPPVIEPRRHIHPPAVIEPPAVYHSPPRIESAPEAATARLAAPCSRGPDEPAAAKPVFQPPWDVHLWPRHHHVPVNHFKPVCPHPDILTKGMLIDLFI
jgi:hypothetical protein